MNTVVICYASEIACYDRRTPELSNATLHMNQDVNSIEYWPLFLRDSHNFTCEKILNLNLNYNLDLPAPSCSRAGPPGPA